MLARTPLVVLLVLLLLIVLVPGPVLVAAAVGVQEAAPDARRPLQGMTINIDPGHNPGNGAHVRQINRIVSQGPIRKACDTAGTSTNDGYAEWRFTLQLATRLGRRLQARGARVTFTHALGRPAWGPCITGRAAIGNRADAAISLHADGAPSSARGFHVIKPGYVPGYTGDIVRRSGVLATLIRDELEEGTSIPISTYAGRRGIDVRKDLGGLTLSDVPKVFVEHGNMRNSRDATLLQNPREQERMAIALSSAIVAWHAGEVH